MVDTLVADKSDRDGKTEGERERGETQRERARERERERERERKGEQDRGMPTLTWLLARGANERFRDQQSSRARARETTAAYSFWPPPKSFGLQVDSNPAIVGLGGPLVEQAPPRFQ